MGNNIYFRILKNVDNTYSNVVEYRINNSILKNLESIEDFYDKFFAYICKTEVEYLSTKELKEVRKIRICNKNGREIYFDKNFIFIM